MRGLRRCNTESSQPPHPTLSSRSQIYLTSAMIHDEVGQARLRAGRGSETLCSPREHGCTGAKQLALESRELWDCLWDQSLRSSYVLRNEQGAADSAPDTRKQTVHATWRGIVFPCQLPSRSSANRETADVVESAIDVRPMFPRNEQGMADSTKATSKQTVHDGWQSDFFAHAPARSLSTEATRIVADPQSLGSSYVPGERTGGGRFVQRGG
jgi:hypothetical protein